MRFSVIDRVNQAERILEEGLNPPVSDAVLSAGYRERLATRMRSI